MKPERNKTIHAEKSENDQATVPVQDNDTAIQYFQVKDPNIEKYKKSKAVFICCFVAAGMLVSIAYHYYIICNGRDFYPYNTFLFGPAARFNDFFMVYKATFDNNPYYQLALYKGNYFPFSYILMRLFDPFDVGKSILLFTSSFIIFLVVYLYRNIPFDKAFQKIIAAIVLTLSYPVLFEIDRGNLECWSFMALVMFISFYLKGKDMLSVIFLSMAISLKLFPAIFVILFIIDRKYLMVLYTFLITAGISLLSAALLKGGVYASITGLLSGLSDFTKSTILSNASSPLHHNSSLFAPLKLMYYDILMRLSTDPALYQETFSKIYTCLVLVLFIALFFVLIKYKFYFWKIVTLIIMSFILLQQISYDYKLIHVLIATIIFINSNDRSKYDIVYLIIFGLLLVPKDYYIIIDEVSISSIINPLLIMLIIALIIAETIKSGEKLKLPLFNS